MMLAHYTGRPELWEPFDRLLGYFTRGVPEILDVSLATLGDPVRTAAGVLDELDQIIESLDGEADPAIAARAGIAAFYVDRLPDCRDALRSVLKVARAGGIHAAAIVALNLLSFDAYRVGRWDESREHADEAVALCTLHTSPYYSWSGRYVQALLAAATGDYDSAQAIAEAMMRWAGPRDVLQPFWFAWHARTLVTLGKRDYEEAFRTASRSTRPERCRRTSASPSWFPWTLSRRLNGAATMRTPYRT